MTSQFNLNPVFTSVTVHICSHFNSFRHLAPTSKSVSLLSNFDFKKFNHLPCHNFEFTTRNCSRTTTSTSLASSSQFLFLNSHCRFFIKSMNGYKKIRLVPTTKSKSIDFSDIYSPPRTPKPFTTQPQHQLPPLPPAKQDHTKEFHTITTQDQEEEGGKIFGLVLSRNGSTSSTTSQRFKTDKHGTTLQSAVKRAFSMRRSTSVSEGYSRIYDQNDPALCSSPTDDAHVTMQKKGRKKKKGSKILRVCKSLFGM